MRIQRAVVSGGKDMKKKGNNGKNVRERVYEREQEREKEREKGIKGNDRKKTYSTRKKLQKRSQPRILPSEHVILYAWEL